MTFILDDGSNLELVPDIETEVFWNGAVMVDGVYIGAWDPAGRRWRDGLGFEFPRATYEEVVMDSAIRMITEIDREQRTVTYS